MSRIFVAKSALSFKITRMKLYFQLLPEPVCDLYRADGQATELNNETKTSLACGKERGLKRARLKNAFYSREKYDRVLKTNFFFYSRPILIFNVSRDKINF